MKIAVIGFGAAAIGFLEGLKNTSHEIHVFEKSPDIYSSSISGIRADGKLFVSKDMGGDIDIDLTLQKKLVDYYVNHTQDKNIETGISFGNTPFFNKFYQEGFQPISADFYHLGTDQLKEVLFNIYENFKQQPHIHFHFNYLVTSVEKSNGQIKINHTDLFDNVYVAVGRSGHPLIKSIIKKMPKLILDNTKIDLGIRFELPNHIIEELNKEMY